MQPIDVSPTNLETVRQILQQHVPELEVRAFGSRGGWTARETSDLDLALMTDARLDIGKMVALKAAFTKSNLPFRVDIVDWASTSASFRRVIEMDYAVLVAGNVASFDKRNSVVAGEWHRAALKDLVEIFDGPHATPKKTHSGPVFLGISNLDSGRLDLAKTEHLTEEDYVQWTRRVTPKTGDVVFSYETRIGEAALIPAGLRCCLGRRMGLLRPKGGKIDPRFLLYAFLGPRFQDTLGSRTIHGSTVNRIPLTEMGNFPIEISTDIHEQRTIAHILGTLDDKIELNRRMNETLEAMARALFKSWFVDFDPVRAKMAGRDTGLPQHIADLFPDRMVDSELGEIPEGWEVKSFAETVEIIGGGTPKTSVSEYWDGDIPWFSVADAPTQSDIWVVDTAKKITRIGIENSSTRILPVGTTIISARGTVGRIALVGTPMAMNQSCYGVRSKISAQGLFDYFAIHGIVEILQQRTHGSVFDTITRNTLARVRVVSPFPEFVDAFEELIRPALERIHAGLLETRTLGTLRDTLLPNLISGELRIKDAERIVEIA